MHKKLNVQLNLSKSKLVNNRNFVQFCENENLNTYYFTQSKMVVKMPEPRKISEFVRSINQVYYVQVPNDSSKLQEKSL